MSVFELYNQVQKEMEVLTDNDFYTVGEKTFKIRNQQKVLEVSSEVLIISPNEILFVNPANMQVTQRMTLKGGEKCIDALLHPTNCVSLYCSKSLKLIKKIGSRWFLLKQLILTHLSMKPFYQFFYCPNQKLILLGNSKTIFHIDLNYSFKYLVSSKKPICQIQLLSDMENYIVAYKHGLIEKRSIETSGVLADINTRCQIKKVVLQDDNSIQVCEKWEKKHFLIDSNLQLINISVDGFSQYLSFSQQKQLSENYWIMFQPNGVSIVKRLDDKGDKFSSKKILEIAKYDDLLFRSCAIGKNLQNLYLLFQNDDEEALLRVYDFQCILEESGLV